MDAELARALDRGAVVVIPTDTVYGLATRADNTHGIDRIYELKGRPADKPFQALVDGVPRLDELGEPSPIGRALADAFWPGALTIIVRARAGAPVGVVREGRIGLRAPNHPVPLALVAASGPLAATSANLSGAPTPSSVEAVRAVFGDAVDVYVDGGVVPSRASTVVDVSDGELTIVREGPITSAALRSAIGA